MIRIRWRASAVALALVACAGRQRLEQVSQLSEEDSALYAKYRQFMTETQQDEFLALSSEGRREYIRQLKVEERLEHYPPFIRQAIWAQDVVPGMDTVAVLLSWGTPELREIDEQELERGNQVERWNYHRDGAWRQVVVTNGVVTNVVHAELQK
jgi:hypothetical protein